MDGDSMATSRIASGWLNGRIPVTGSKATHELPDNAPGGTGGKSVGGLSSSRSAAASGSGDDAAQPFAPVSKASVPKPVTATSSRRVPAPPERKNPSSSLYEGSDLNRKRTTKFGGEPADDVTSNDADSNAPKLEPLNSATSLNVAPPSLETWAKTKSKPG